MPSLTVDQGALVRLIWAISGTPWAVNVLACRAPTNVQITQALANTLGTAIKGRLASSGHGANIHTTVSLLNVGIRDVRSANLPEFMDSGAAVAGTGTGITLPLQTAFVITLRTALAGPRFRGRVYLGGFAAAANAGSGSAITGVGTAGVAFVTGIQTDMTTSGLTLAVMSKPVFNADGSVARAGVVNNVTLIQARDSVWDTQRRRQIPGI